MVIVKKGSDVKTKVSFIAGDEFIKIQCGLVC